MLKSTFIATVTMLIMGAMLSPSSTAEAKRIKDINYEDGGKIIYYKDPINIPKDRTRICLRNQTGQPKMMKWIRILPQGKVNHIVARTNGAQGCVTIPSNQRVEWTFQDRGEVVRRQAATLNNFGGDIILFHWVADNNFHQKASCGGLNQRPCTIFERFPSCDPGLYEVPFTSCKAIVPGTEPYLALIGKHQAAALRVTNCMNTPSRIKSLRAAGNSRDQQAAARATEACLPPSTLSALRQPSQGFTPRTISIGVGPGAGAIVSGAAEVGVVVSLAEEHGAISDKLRIYTSADYTIGVQAGVGVDIIVGVSQDPLQTGVNDNWSVNAGGKLLAGASIAVVFNYDGASAAYENMSMSRFNGFSIAGGLGLGFDLGTIHRSNSRIWGTDPIRTNVTQIKNVPNGPCLDATLDRLAIVATCLATNDMASQGWSTNNAVKLKIKGDRGLCLDIL